jgi:hypothetical protein
MSAILLQTDVVVFTDPMSKNNHPHRWWADRGLINWEDQITGAYGTLTVKQTLERLNSLHAMIGNSRTGKGYSRPDECNAYGNFIDQMIGLCKKAREQGMPDDQKHAKQKVEEFKNKRQSRAMVLPGFNSQF